MPDLIQCAGCGKTAPAPSYFELPEAGWIRVHVAPGVIGPKPEKEWACSLQCLKALTENWLAAAPREETPPLTPTTPSLPESDEIPF